MLKDLAMQSIRELGLFKKYAKKYQKNGIIYHEINPEHNIMELYAKSVKKKCSEPFIVLCHDKAMAANARRLGFINDFAIMDRYEALSIKMKINAGLPEKNGLKKTIATKIIEFS